MSETRDISDDKILEDRTFDNVSKDGKLKTKLRIVVSQPKDDEDDGER